MGLLGLDIGTTGCKATIFDYDGNVKVSAYREYTLLSPRPGQTELDPEKVWRSVKEVIRRSAAGYKGEKIKAVSISSFGEAAIPLDKGGNILGNSIMYTDRRGEEEVRDLEQKLGGEKVLSITGASVHPMYTLGKLMWLKKHHPDIYRNAWKFMLYAGFILHRLGAEPHIDYSLAGRTMAFDIVKKQWSEQILDCAGIEKDKLPLPVQSGTIVGEVTSDVAEDLGLPAGILLVSGGHDQPCAALGAGVIRENIAVDGMGTVECITPALNRPVISKQMAEANLVCVPHLKKDMYVTYAFNFTGGSLLKWFRDNFAYEERLLAAEKGVDVYDLLIDKAVDYPTDVYILPYFAGAGTPYMDTEAKGAVIGLKLDTSREEIIKAVLEGITYEMMLNLECLDRAGVRLDELRAVGGGAKSGYWLQLKADMMGKRIVSLNVSEAGTLGVAMLAGTASGVYSSLDDAVERLVKVKQVYYPDEEKHRIYQGKYLVYKNIYPHIKSILNYRGDPDATNIDENDAG